MISSCVQISPHSNRAYSNPTCVSIYNLNSVLSHVAHKKFYQSTYFDRCKLLLKLFPKLFLTLLLPFFQGANCCSESAISFHYITPNMMYVMDYLVYRFRAKGLNSTDGWEIIETTERDSAISTTKRSQNSGKTV